MKRALILIAFLYVTAHGQALRDINYNYRYNPSVPFSCHLKPVRAKDSSWTILYKLVANDSSHNVRDLRIKWETRRALSDAEGQSLSADSITGPSGVIHLPAMQGEVILVAKVLDPGAKLAWLFYEYLHPEYPINGYVKSITDEEPVFERYVDANAAYKLRYEDAEKVTVSYYNPNFPPAAPAFSEAMAPVPVEMNVVRTEVITTDDTIKFNESGLYLIQSDTSTARGFAFRAEHDYPKYNTMENLVGPLIYVSSKQEFERLRESKGEKKAFDKVILSITGDKERAKTFMRNYFQRVELANRYFSSYKEGWKTDRGMIYIVCGLPNEVFLFKDREIWTYKNDAVKETFSFVRSGTLFDPDNYVLVRERKYKNNWYKIIEYWRNARF